ncbi:hypothetical protein B0O99DRAFT_689790 [Bisporella sp. PMI_857]|nr:hypothetical protein B0O99DRAFT_689790 [Bisporella sp. PMI_857]
MKSFGSILILALPALSSNTLVGIIDCKSCIDAVNTVCSKLYYTIKEQPNCLCRGEGAELFFQCQSFCSNTIHSDVMGWIHYCIARYPDMCQTSQKKIISPIWEQLCVVNGTSTRRLKTLSTTVFLTSIAGSHSSQVSISTQSGNVISEAGVGSFSSIPRDVASSSLGGNPGLPEPTRTGSMLGTVASSTSIGSGETTMPTSVVTNKSSPALSTEPRMTAATTAITNIGTPYSTLFNTSAEAAPTKFTSTDSKAAAVSIVAPVIGLLTGIWACVIVRDMLIQLE